MTLKAKTVDGLLIDPDDEDSIRWAYAEHVVQCKHTRPHTLGILSGPTPSPDGPETAERRRWWSLTDAERLAEALAMREAERADPEWQAEEAKRIAYRDRKLRVLDSPGAAIENADIIHHKGRLRLTPAEGMTYRRTRWLWDDRLALGTLALIGGREGTGKTILSDTLAADITRGTLLGEGYGHPRNVIIVTSEDSWQMTVVPRLMAAGADLRHILRAEAETQDGALGGLSLPRDLGELETAVVERNVALIILDPLMSRLGSELDTHKDADVRLALEPLVALAERTRTSMLGLIHVNKSGSTDPLTQLMASRAFPAVARAVLFVMDDPDETGAKLLGQAKNNLGRTDLPTLRFRIEGIEVGKDPEDGKPVEAGRLVWLEETTRTLATVIEGIMAGPKMRTKGDEAAIWLRAFLQSYPTGRASSADIVTAATEAGHSESALKRARSKLGIESIAEGFPRRTYWQLPADLIIVQ